MEVPLQKALLVVRGNLRAGGTQSLVTLKMEAICSSETSVLVTGATQHHILEDILICKT
jgi:hypothetical protein